MDEQTDEASSVPGAAEQVSAGQTGRWLRLALANAPIVLFAIDREGVFTVSEGDGLGGLGLKPGEAVGQSVFEVFRDVPEIGEGCQRALNGESFRESMKILDRCYDMTYEPIADENGLPAGAVGVAVDVTEHQLAEEELRRNKIIVAGSSDMLALLDKEYTYLAANTAYLKPLGKTYDQVVGHTVAEVLGAEFFNAVIRPNADRCLGGAEVHYQEWLDFPASEKRYMDISYYPYVGADNEVRGFVVNARDITERRRTEEALHARERQQAAVAELGQRAPGGRRAFYAHGRCRRPSRSNP